MHYCPPQSNFRGGRVPRVPRGIYATDSDHILHNDKDHQILFVGAPNMRETNPRWRTAATLKKSEKFHNSAMVWPIGTKFGTMTQTGHTNPTGS